MTAEELRQAVLATPDAEQGPLKPVPTPEWPTLDGQVFVRTLSGLEADAFDGDENNHNARARLAVIAACDATGKRIFVDADAVPLGKKFLPVLDRIYWAAHVHNGLTRAARAELEKNSPGTAAAGSPTS